MVAVSFFKQSKKKITFDKHRFSSESSPTSCHVSFSYMIRSVLTG
jgi:hypothetical protein